ncbi:MAG: hypothetical protein WC563_15435 [Brevundimonas sp.]
MAGSGAVNAFDPLDILASLKPLKFRGIEVPCLSNSIKVGQNLVEHNQYGVAGGEQENTCRKSAHLSFTIPFRAGIVWKPSLYPKVMRDFWNACCDGTTGPLSHPEFGLMDVKVGDFDLTWQPNARDGADMNVSFVETIEKGLRIELSASSPITYASSIADELEKLGPMVKLPSFDNSTGTTLKGALAKIKGAMLLAQMSAASLLGDIESTIGGVNNLIDFASSLTDPAAWPVVAGLKNIVSALMQIETQLGTDAGKKKKLEIKYTTTDASPTLVASQFGTNLEDLFKANPSLAILDPVPSGTMVFVFVK